MNAELEIRAQLVSFLAGDLRAEELEDWLHDFAWDLESEPVRSLAAASLRLLAEFQNGDWDADELGVQLAALARSYSYDLAPANVVATTTGPLIEVQSTLAGEAETRRVVASV